METIGTAKAPLHLWLIGVVILLWNAVGAADYVMTQIKFDPYMSEFTAEQLEFFYGFPAWVNAAWAIAVWGGVLGAILLLLRNKLAAPVFIASFAAMVVTSIHNFLLADGMAVMGTGGAIFSAVIFVIAGGLIFYSRALAAGGVLK